MLADARPVAEQPSGMERIFAPAQPDRSFPARDEFDAVIRKARALDGVIGCAMVAAAGHDGERRHRGRIQVEVKPSGRGHAQGEKSGGLPELFLVGGLDFILKVKNHQAIANIRHCPICQSDYA